jgi:hypothetical protein
MARRSLWLDFCARLGQGHHRRVRSAERGGDRRASYCSGEGASPAGQKTVREVGVEVHGGGDALKLVGGGLRPGVPRGGIHGSSADGQAHARRSAEQALYAVSRRGSPCFTAKARPTLMPCVRCQTSTGALDRESIGQTGGPTARSSRRRAGAWRVVGGCPEDAAHGPGVTGPPRRLGMAARWRRRVAAL